MAEGNRGDLEKLFADKLPARIMATTAGLIVAGPVGALVASAMAPVVEHLLSAGNQRFINNAARMTEAAAEISGHPEPDNFKSYIEGDDARLTLTVDAVRYASDTHDERKLLSLARVLGYGLADDANLDMGAIYLRALRDLEPFHIRVLATFANWHAQPTGARQEGIMQDGDLSAAHPNLRDGLGPIMATLEREGLIEQAMSDGNASFASIGGRVITPFGRRVLEWTRSAVVDQSDGGAAT